MKIPYDMKNTLSILGLPTLRKHQLRPIQDILLRRDTLSLPPPEPGNQLSSKYLLCCKPSDGA